MRTHYTRVPLQIFYEHVAISHGNSSNSPIIIISSIFFTCARHCWLHTSDVVSARCWQKLHVRATTKITSMSHSFQIGEMVFCRAVAHRINITLLLFQSKHIKFSAATSNVAHAHTTTTTAKQHKVIWELFGCYISIKSTKSTMEKKKIEFLLISTAFK